LRAVKRGQTIHVLDRDTPVARIVPVAAEGSVLAMRPASLRKRPLVEVPLPAPLDLRIDVVALLAEERGQR